MRIYSLPSTLPFGALLQMLPCMLRCNSISQNGQCRTHNQCGPFSMQQQVTAIPLPAPLLLKHKVVIHWPHARTVQCPSVLEVHGVTRLYDAFAAATNRVLCTRRYQVGRAPEIWWCAVQLIRSKSANT
ncbi:hypothetical protein B0T26DRAFT_233409 [Lasiosphaeria miniovina]|uniref:Uncharacterized protein n=1 Tax=Lasiosphaeria miniovina TaxID=1954250 RepID=A0AA40AVH4_9PEZI|nr:uncharacterized protein B0T26DRAFT_233409 [Lasiosphaeria miniovina]KAK0722792.1 hypothetical protein B0T26DRAFT_233409 [Lasiosphaeria miniovina]